jgi:predicted dehydrogenase
MTKIVGIGLIGAGWMGTAHSRAYLQAFDRFPDSGIRARLVTCADESESRAREAQQRFNFVRSTTSWREVIADPEVDVVDITTPNYLHREIALAAAAAGKHISCEKPVGRNLDETAEIERAARRVGVLNWVGFNYRWAPMVQYARELIAMGKLGRLTHFRGRFLAGYASNPATPLSWRFEREFSGSGVSGDLLSHVIDMSLFMAGPIKRTVANHETFIPQRPASQGQLKQVTNEDYVGALVQFANGAHGTLEVCRVIQGHKCDWAFEIEGTQGALSWNFERMNELNVFLPGENKAHDGYARIVTGPNYPLHSRFNPATGTGLGYDDLKTIEAHHFLKSIHENKQEEPGLREALRVAEVMAAVERSWTSRCWEDITQVSQNSSSA